MKRKQAGAEVRGAGIPALALMFALAAAPAAL